MSVKRNVIQRIKARLFQFNQRYKRHFKLVLPSIIYISSDKISLILHGYQVICKSWNRELGNGTRKRRGMGVRMMGNKAGNAGSQGGNAVNEGKNVMNGIGMQGIMVEMRERRSKITGNVFA